MSPVGGAVLADRPTRRTFGYPLRRRGASQDTGTHGAKPLNLRDSRASYLPPGLSPCQQVSPASPATQFHPAQGLVWSSVVGLAQVQMEAAVAQMQEDRLPVRYKPEVWLAV